MPSSKPIVSVRNGLSIRSNHPACKLQSHSWFYVDSLSPSWIPITALINCSKWTTFVMRARVESSWELALPRLLPCLPGAVSLVVPGESLRFLWRCAPAWAWSLAWIRGKQRPSLDIFYPEDSFSHLSFGSCKKGGRIVSETIPSRGLNVGPSFRWQRWTI